VNVHGGGFLSSAEVSRFALAVIVVSQAKRITTKRSAIVRGFLPLASKIAELWLERIIPAASSV